MRLLGAILFVLHNTDEGTTYGKTTDAIRPERNCLRSNAPVIFTSIRPIVLLYQMLDYSDEALAHEFLSKM